ncbi:50S ribosomal protein L30, partial [Dysosmobacter welbionis]
CGRGPLLRRLRPQPHGDPPRRGQRPANRSGGIPGAGATPPGGIRRPDGGPAGHRAGQPVRT